ncbi:hypothetical protein GGER_43240 [Serratia rubidaea]
MQRNVLIVFTGFRVGKDIGNLLLVRRAQHKGCVVEGVLGEEGQGFRRNFQDFLPFKFGDGNVVAA